MRFTMEENVIKVENLVKTYGSVTAVNGISFEVKRGEVFGFLGPNGAGKSTTIETIEGLRKPDSGCVTVLGMNVLTNSRKIKEVIGVQLQSTVLYGELRVRELIDLFGGYYKKRLSTDEMLEAVSLTHKQKAFEHTLSGGEKTRLTLALAMVNEPEILFLDEPTSGLDPHGRKDIWEMIEHIRGERTVIMATHYMEEAEKLCDRVAIVNEGKIVAEDNPKKLIRSANLESTIEFSLEQRVNIKELKKIPGVSSVVKQRDSYILSTGKPYIVLGELSRLYNVTDVSVHEAKLEDLFLKITGKGLKK
jgi:ABC-2 type transport system ATP-binding protein